MATDSVVCFLVATGVLDVFSFIFLMLRLSLVLLAFLPVQDVVVVSAFSACYICYYSVRGWCHCPFPFGVSALAVFFASAFP